MKRMLVNASDPEECRIAIVENGILQELYVELAEKETLLGNIYKGKVVNIEPSIGAAFVSFGGDRNGFLHASDILPAYGDPRFTLEDILTGRARAEVEESPEAVRSALLDADDEARDGGEADTEGAARDAGGQASGRSEPGRSDARPSQVAVPQSGDAPEEGFRGRRAEALEGEVASEGERGDEQERRGEAEAEVLLPDTPEPAAEAPGACDAAEEDPDADPGDSGEPVWGCDAEARAVPPNAGGDEGESEEGETGAGTGAKPRRRRRRRRANPSGTGREQAVKTAAGPLVQDLRHARSDRRGRASRRRRNPRQRHNRPVQELLKKGQEVIVQVTKEGIGAKGPTLTTYLSLPGRCLVLMPSLPKCGVSRKISDPRERRRLKRIVKNLDRTGSGGIGFIVRTAGVRKTAADLERDLEYLEKLWEVIVQRARVTRAPAPLYVESDLVLRTIRDFFTPDIDEVVVDSEEVYHRVRDFVEKLMPQYADRVKHHSGYAPLFLSYGIESAVEDLYKPRVDLPNGGSIVIEQTEALVAIDVNSGKFKPGSDLEETAFRMNKETIPEIVRQLRLRDLGGVIIIDFIDMTEERHRREIERCFREALKNDRARINVGRISIFGLLELTRQRVGPGLKRTVFQTCPTCKGTSLVRTVQSKALAVLREIRALARLPGYHRLEAYLHPEVTSWLENSKRRSLIQIETDFGREIVTKPEPSYPVDVVHYRFLDAAGKEVKVNIPAGLGVHS